MSPLNHKMFIMLLFFHYTLLKSIYVTIYIEVINLKSIYSFCYYCFIKLW